MKKTTEMPCRIGERANIFIWAVIILNCLYIIIDPIDRYFQQGVLGLVGYKSYFYSAQDMFFALCAVVGLSNLVRLPLLGWILTNISIAGFIIFPIYYNSAGFFFRANMMDSWCIMSILSFILLFIVNKKGCRPTYWYVYLPLIVILTSAMILIITYLRMNGVWRN